MANMKKAVPGYDTVRLRSGRLENTPIYSMSTPPPPPPGPRTPGKGCAQCTVCSTEIRLLRQRSGLAGYRALPASLSPLAGAQAEQGT